MRKEPIILEWIERGKKYRKEINRKEILDLMKSIKQAFEENQISSILAEKIPDIVSILINKDRNEEKDVPSICYKTENQEEVIDIKRCHKIIWSILDHYCTETE